MVNDYFIMLSFGEILLAKGYIIGILHFAIQ